MKEKYLPLGNRGYFGTYTDSENNKKSKELNKFVDEYNSKINTFDTMEENLNFAKYISDEIEKCLKN